MNWQATGRTSDRAMEARREGREIAHTSEGAEIEATVADLMDSCLGHRWPGRRVRFFPIPDDIEGALLTREGL